MDINLNSAASNSRADKIWAGAMQWGARTGCHQRNDRSFSLGGYQLPLCARCTGLLAGQLVAIALCGAMAVCTGRQLLLAAALALGLLGVDGTGQLLGYWTSNNPRRLATGLFCGFFTMSCLLRGLVVLVGRI